MGEQSVAGHLQISSALPTTQPNENWLHWWGTELDCIHTDQNHNGRFAL